MIEEKIQEKMFLDEVVGFVCQENCLLINRSLIFIGLNKNQELQAFQITLLYEQVERKIKKNELLYLRDSQISFEKDNIICLEFIENVTKLCFGETKILQNVGLQQCQKICSQLQEYRRMFMLYQIADPRRREIQQFLQNILREQNNRREQARRNCIKANQ